MIRSFKIFSSKRINLLLKDVENGSQPFYLFKLHKSFHDRIIRNEIELNNVRNYIKNNPLKWHQDIENYPKSELGHSSTVPEHQTPTRNKR